MVNAGSQDITRHQWVSTQLSHEQPKDGNGGILAQVTPYQEPWDVDSSIKATP
jgi:hypothetical protein